MNSTLSRCIVVDIQNGTSQGSSGTRLHYLMPLSIEVRGLDGVSLLSPSDPEFDTLAAPLLGRATALVLRLKPFLVLVQNESARTVVAFSKTLRITHAAGRVGTLQDQNIFPHVVCGDTVSGLDAPGIAPGERRIDGHGVVLYGWGNLDPYFDQFLPQFIEQKDRTLADATLLQIELDAVVFDDGTLVGADESLRAQFSAYLEAKQHWYRHILAALDAGQSVAEAFQPLDDFRAAERRRRDQVPPPPHGPIWKGQAAADADRWRRRHAEPEIHRLLKETIRLEPFVIRRRT
jgi:hypothetical protein